jgi:hypothetical protein
MAFRRRHHQLRSLIDGIFRPVPVDNHSIDPAAHHVVNLALHLRHVGLAITDVHVVRLPEPKNHVGINLGRRARIEQSVDIDLTDIACAPIVVALCRKSICRAGVIGGLSSQGRCGHYVGRTRKTQARRSQQNCRYQSKAHGSSGAEQ